MGMLHDEFLTVAEVAELLKLNQQTEELDRPEAVSSPFPGRARMRTFPADLEECSDSKRLRARQ